MNRRGVIGGALGFAFLPSAANSAVCASSGIGHYVGELHFKRYYPDLFELTASRSFVDPCGKHWPVPKGALTDGASIPRIAQLFVGDPYSGPYFDAAVIHDWFCVTRTEPHDDVHQMFYHGMIASKVSPTLARIMYTAVCWKGPKWDNLTMQNSRRMVAANPSIFIDRERPAGPIGGAPPPQPPQPVASPNRRMLEMSRKALEAKDIATAESILMQYEAEVAEYEAYKKARKEYDDRRAEAEEKYERNVKEKKKAFDEDAAKFRKLLQVTESGNKSLEEIAMIADKYDE